MPILGASSSGAKPAPTVPTSTSAANAGSGRAYNNGSATVSFSAPTTSKLPVTSYTATSSPGSFTATGASSPLTVTGLQSNTQYVFTVTATSAAGTSNPSAASGIITATTVPQAPTIGTATDGGTGTTVSVPFTAGATGGSSITSYTVTSSPGSITGTGASSPITVSGLSAGTAYTFTVTATNANGTSLASAASNSVTPTVPSSFESIATISPSGTGTVTFSSIPQTYKSLQIRSITKFNQTNAADYTDILMAFNGNALTKSHMLRGNGSTVSALSSTETVGVSINNHSSLASNFSPTIIDIVDYASTTKNKTVRSISGVEANAYPRAITLNSAFLTNTAAVTSITLTNASGVFWTPGTTFALYGIK
jgi:hypothetical protein